MKLPNAVVLSIASVAILGLVLGGSTVMAGPIYGPLTYDSGDPSTQGGEYTFNQWSRLISFDNDNLSLTMTSSNRGHGLVFDGGFSTALSSYEVTTTHVSSAVAGDRRGLMGYAVDGVGAIGVFIGKGGGRYGAILEDGGEQKISFVDPFTADQQVQGDGVSELDIAGTFTIGMSITDTGSDATSTFAYTFTQESNVWQMDLSFQDLIDAVSPHSTTASDLIAAARDPGQEVGYAYYTFLGATNGNEVFDNTSVVPEPSSVVLAGLGLLSLALWGWRRRR